MLKVVPLGFEEISRAIVDGDGSDLIAGSVKLTAAFARIIFSRDFIDDMKSVGDLAKYRMAIIEEWSGGGGDEKLGAVGPGTGVGHGENAGAAVTKIGVKFIGKLVSGAAPTALGRVAALKHEIFDNPVKGDPVIVSALCEIEEIRASQRGFGGIHRCVDVASGGVHGDFDVVHRVLELRRWRTQ